MDRAPWEIDDLLDALLRERFGLPETAEQERPPTPWEYQRRRRILLGEDVVRRNAA